MDIQMPIMDGLTATRALRGRAGFNELPVIAMTAHTMAHEKEISKRAGMNDHIGKPFDNAGFYRTLAQWIPVEKRVKQGPAPAEIKPVRPSVADGRLAALVNIDTATGIGRFGGKEERYLSWLNLFVEEGPATVAEIRQLLGSSTSEAASRVAHAFKGRVGMLGMSELHPVVSALETTLRAAEPADELLDKVEEIVKQTSVEIKAVLARLEPLPASAAGLPQTGQEA
jgi:CheY-like chemotaxis protein